MAIIRRRGNNDENINMSGSKKVGRANSKDVKKKQRNSLVLDGVVIQLDNTGKPVAPVIKKKNKKSIADMVKEAHKD